MTFDICDCTKLPRMSVHMISDFRVETMTSIVEKLKRREIMSERGKLSDHSMISCTINVSPYCAPQSTSDTATDSRNTQTSDTVRKYNVSNIPDDFLSHISVKNALLSAIQRLEYIHIRQDDIDSIYNNFVEIVHNEMDNKLDHHDIGCHKPPRSKYRCRPYWNEHLSRLWREARDSEKLYLKSSSRSLKRELRQVFKTKRGVFDKTLRKQERLFISEQRNFIDNYDPKNFWNFIKKLGPKRQKNM